MYGCIESDMTYTGVVHEYVKSLLSCEEGFHAWLYCRRVREVNIHELETAKTLRKGILDARNSGGSFGLGSAGNIDDGVMCVKNLAGFESYISVSTSHDQDLD